MYYPKAKKVSTLLLISTLIGCGGGSGGGAAPTSTTVNVDNNQVESEQIEPVTNAVLPVIETDLRMSDLVASDDFKFTNKQQVQVSLDLSELLAVNNQTGKRAYVSVYRDYQRLPSGQFYPLSESRLLAGELNNGQFNHAFVAMNNQSEYLIEVWFYNGDPAIQKQQMLVNNTLTW